MLACYLFILAAPFATGYYSFTGVPLVIQHSFLDLTNNAFFAGFLLRMRLVGCFHLPRFFIRRAAAVSMRHDVCLHCQSRILVEKATTLTSIKHLSPKPPPCPPRDHDKQGVLPFVKTSCWRFESATMGDGDVCRLPTCGWSVRRSASLRAW